MTCKSILHSMYNKTIIRYFSFCDIQNNQGVTEGLSASAFALAYNFYLDLDIILDITKTSSNNCLWFIQVSHAYWSWGGGELNRPYHSFWQNLDR